MQLILAPGLPTLQNPIGLYMDKASFDPNDILVRTINTLAMHNIAHCVVDIIQFWQLDDNQACRLLGEISTDIWEQMSARTQNSRISVAPMIFLRMELILGIHQILSLLVPNQTQIEWC